ncbi:hypothetical protein DAPPUDRAFT_234482 [Daphnia pulex]|uniref:Uncharacterized protein n=1 Tax=Daphnia pulex TaxID=6669 RepID=E9FWQ3_DAPPU|nr:hypothetical protein DAPPUDRAFT_234482 [Daphnia pulex]|eukprot:EFX87934.1 hypothetical protein DAPPUDRAFT_234482 [Daphnia pulex]
MIRMMNRSRVCDQAPMTLSNATYAALPVKDFPYPKYVMCLVVTMDRLVLFDSVKGEEKVVEVVKPAAV